MPAVRYYFPSTGAAAVSPAFDGGWEDTSIATRLAVVLTRIASAMTTVSFADGDITNKDILFRQYVTGPLPAQTIAAQTIKLVMRCLETGTGNNLFLTLGVRAVSNDGSTVRGTLVAVSRDNTEAATGTLTSRTYSAAGSSVAILDNDRLVLEVGLGGDPSVGSSHSGSMRIGDAAATDLDDSDSDTGDDNPWLEFTTGLIVDFPTATRVVGGGKIMHGSITQGGIVG